MRGSDFAEVRAFITIVEEGSFARAAARLRIAPSSLSQILRNLEARLGVRLLNRTTRSLSLTAAGHRLLSRFQPALAEMEAAIDDARALKDSPTGTVRLYTSRHAAASFLEPHLGAFHATYPDIVLDVTVDDAVNNIVEAGYDVAIRLGERLEQDMVALPLGPEMRQLPVATPAYFDRHGRPATPADLLGHRCINWRWPGTRGLYNWEFFKDGHWMSVAVGGPLVVSHRDLALSAALQGVGIAFWTDSLVRPLVDAGRLEVVLEEYCAPFPGWHLCYPRQRYMAAPVRAFIEFCRQMHAP